MPVRESASTMSNAKWTTFIKALIGLKADIVNPTAPANQQISRYDQFTALHTAVLRVRTPDNGTTNMGHQSAGFGPWHREFLIRFENALRDHEPNAFVPWWDWTDHTGTSNAIFTNDHLGARNGLVSQGYFAFDAPGLGSNSTPSPDWWPDSLEGWRIPLGLQRSFGPALTRINGNRPLAEQAHIEAILDAEVFEGGTSEMWTDPDGFQQMLAGGFRTRIEGGTGGVPRSHNYVHGWVGGHMGHPYTSPGDPTFYLHHANIDRLWSEWQANGHAGSAFYPDTGFQLGHNLNDAMWPWVGMAPDYLSLSQVTGLPLPDYSTEPARRPVDVMDITSLGYSYA
ncbi:MAG: tyrosinase family protein [Rhodobacteraceae bacterium]|nr:tyrosinase family protein [Paracoccaceae bacterium]